MLTWIEDRLEKWYPQDVRNDPEVRRMFTVAILGVATGLGYYFFTIILTLF